jgi:hypothetical protein
MRIFISYRRDDVDIVSRIRADIARRGHEVFQDTHGIEYGDVFKTTTLGQLDAAGVVLFVIGPNWLRQVLDETKPDWIRLELEHALQRSNRPRIIPVLVREAKLPREDELPKSMQELLGYHAIAIPSGPGYEFFIAQLMRAIEGGKSWSPLKKLSAIGGAALALLVTGLVLAKLALPATNETLLPPPGAAAGSDAPPQRSAITEAGASGAHGGQPSDSGGSDAAGSGSSTEAEAAKAPEPVAPVTTAPRGQLGQRCNKGKCQQKLQCIEASDTCQALPLEVGTPCDAHAQCASTLCSASKECASLPAQGAACASGRCGPGLTCVSASTTCEKLPLLTGQKCDADGQCQTGLCNASHTCAALGQGAPCVEGRCSSGMYCTTGDSSGRCYRVGDHCPTGSRGACANGKYKLSGQRLLCDAPKPTTETCAAGDEDCDGQVNETNASGCKSFGIDQDGDGFFVDIRCECGSRPGLEPVPPPGKLDPYPCVRATSTWSIDRMTACNGKGATFDWNHNGAEEKRFQQLGAVTGGFGQGCKLTQGWDKTVPGCGQQGDWVSDCSEVAGNLNRRITKKNQECR